MPLIAWNDDLSVGLATFDAQHRELVALVNELHEAMLARKGSEIMGNILDRLVSYTVKHFTAEEKLMHSQTYPGYLAHKGEHDFLTKKVMEIKGKFDRGEMVMTVEVMAFLKDWLAGHIKGTDKKYGPFFLAKGVR